MCGGSVMCNKIKERGCLAVAIISVIATAFLLLASVIKLTLDIAKTYSESNDEKSITNLNTEMLIIAMVLQSSELIIFAFINLTAFGFSVMLCDGIWRKNESQVKAYVVFGVTITVVLVTGALTSFAGGLPAVPGVVIIVACAIYCLYLDVIYRMSGNFAEEKRLRRHNLLIKNESLRFQQWMASS